MPSRIRPASSIRRNQPVPARCPGGVPPGTGILGPNSSHIDGRPPEPRRVEPWARSYDLSKGLVGQPTVARASPIECSAGPRCTSEAAALFVLGRLHVSSPTRTRRWHGSLDRNSRPCRRVRPRHRRAHHVLPRPSGSRGVALRGRRGRAADVAGGLRVCLPGSRAGIACEGGIRGEGVRRAVRLAERGQRHPIRGDHRGRTRRRLRPDLHGIARAAQQHRHDARLADPQGPSACRAPGPRVGDRQPGPSGESDRDHPR